MSREQELKQRQAEWLGRLAQGRPVLVYAWELGRAVPILKGLDKCAPFFRPWDYDCDCEYFQGSVAIRTSVALLVAYGHAKTVADHFKGGRKAQLSGLCWPQNALAFVGTDKAGVMNVLNRHQPHDQWTGLMAAVYWWKVLNDIGRTRQCLNAVMPTFGDPDTKVWTAEHEGTGLLLTLLRDWPKKETLRWLIDTTNSTQDMVYKHAGLEDAFLAQVWMGILEDESWTRWLLGRASVSDSKVHPESTPRGRRFCRYRLAMLYIALLGDDRQAGREVAKAPGMEHQFYWTAAMYWQCFLANPVKAKASLIQWSKEAIGWPVRHLAEAWLLHCDDAGRARALIEDRKRQRGEMRDMTTFLNAKAMFALFGERAPMDRLLATAMSESRGSIITHYVKEWLRLDVGDMDTYRDCLTHEESIGKSVLDLVSCAHDWKEQLGDRSAADRCLVKAGAVARSRSDKIRCAHARLELFGDMSGARRLLR